MSQKVTVHKRDHKGDDVFVYPMQVVDRGVDWICLEGRFEIPRSHDLGLFTIDSGDRSVEWFYTERYYNVFCVYQAGSDRLKGFYCNIARPAIISDSIVAADDLELDVLVSARGKIALRDEDDFKALNLTDSEHQQALDAVEQIRALVKSGEPPFDVLES